MASTTLVAVLLLALTVFTANGGSDFQCIEKHCGDELSFCDKDGKCLRGVMCLAACAGEMSCVYKCQATFWNQALAGMVDCALIRHKCIVPPNPNPMTTCKKPRELAQNVELADFTGEFYTVFGKNKDYDCFNNDVKMITKKNNKTLMIADTYDLEKFDGTATTFTDLMELSVQDSNNPSILNLKSLKAAFPQKDEYRVLAATKSYVIVYYCGVSCSITYEGVQVWSRTKTLSKVDLASVSKEIARHGWKLSEFCHTKQTTLL